MEWGDHFPRLLWHVGATTALQFHLALQTMKATPAGARSLHSAIRPRWTETQRPESSPRYKPFCVDNTCFEGGLRGRPYQNRDFENIRRERGRSWGGWVKRRAEIFFQRADQLSNTPTIFFRRHPSGPRPLTGTGCTHFRRHAKFPCVLNQSSTRGEIQAFNAGNQLVRADDIHR